MSGSILSSKSDHLPQLFVLAEFFSNYPPTKVDLENWEKFNNQTFFEYFEKLNWNQFLQLYQDNVNITFESYLNPMNTLIYSHTSLKNQ